MGESRTERAAGIQDAIRQIMFRDWDPIGVCGDLPEDEYDSYIGGVYRILATSRSEDALAQFLAGVELSEAPPDHLRALARKLLALDVRL
jgi:hypothetical protein